jgi:hypothetical protein
MTPKTRVQRHRAKLRDLHCRRLEVWIRMTLIDEVREIARSQNKVMGSVVQAALEVYVTAHTTLRAEQRRLDDDRALLMNQADTPGWRQQVEAFNRQLVAYKERWAWYPQSR